MRQRITRGTFIVCGWLSLAAGLVGVALPLVPTTPFLLLSAFCFSRGSPRIHRWLRDHRRFGPVIRQWESGRSMTRRVKIKAITLVIGTFAVTLILIPATPLVQGILVVLALALSGFLASLPEPVKGVDDPAE